MIPMKMQAGMVNVAKQHCSEEGCPMGATFGLQEDKTPRACARHAVAGMVIVVRKACTSPGCPKRATFGVKDAKR